MPLRPPAILESLSVIGKHLPILAIISLVAALSRYIQISSVEGRFGANGLLFELIAIAARLAIAFTVIGRGNPISGYRKLVAHLMRPQEEHAADFDSTIARIKKNPNPLIADIVSLVVISILANLATFLLASTPPIEVFLKNITIIPFSIVFWTVLLRRLIKPSSSES